MIIEPRRINAWASTSRVASTAVRPSIRTPCPYHSAGRMP